jgi:predicted transcriptional regulator
MSVLTIRLPDDQHERLKALAAHRGISLNKLIEEFTTRAIAEFDSETRFRARAARGDAHLALRLLGKLDVAFGTEQRLAQPKTARNRLTSTSMRGPKARTR